MKSLVGGRAEKGGKLELERSGSVERRPEVTRQPSVVVEKPPPAPPSPDTNVASPEEKGFAKFSVKLFNRKLWRKQSSSSNVKEEEKEKNEDKSPVAPSPVYDPPPPRSQTAPNGFLSPTSPPSSSPCTPMHEKPKTREQQLRERARKLLDEAKRSPSESQLTNPPKPVSSDPSPFVRAVGAGGVTRSKSTKPPEKQHSPEKKIMNPRTSLRRYKKKHLGGQSVEEPTDAPAVQQSESGDVAEVKPVHTVKLTSFDPSAAATVSRRARKQPSSEEPLSGHRKSVYIHDEARALELEQIRIDRLASKLEPKVRAVMKKNEDTNGENTEEEEELLLKWFKLVNEKSALLRRQMQLNVMEKENDLERRVEMLNQVSLYQL